MQIKEQKIKELNILYDAELFVKPEPRLFEEDYLEAEELLEKRVLAGRGSVCFFHWQSGAYVLRHYRRGGLMAKLFGDRYFFSGLARSRAWREWHLLWELRQQGLPVPKPLAARVVRRGLFYRADLITVQIEGAQSLGERLLLEPLSECLWQRIGVVIRRFHQAGVYHADLNLNNILLDELDELDEQDDIHLLDFDKGRRGKKDPAWMQANLARLLRSLRKQQSAQPDGYFDEADWQALLKGYKS